MIRGMKWASALCAIYLLCGCTYANRQLNALNLPVENRARNHTRASLGAEVWTKTSPTEPGIIPTTNPSEVPVPDADGYFVGLAISGGGSRSAVVAPAGMFELQRLEILQKVDYISAVSGGSLVGAYYCLNDRDWNPEAAQKKLTHSFAHDVLLRAFNHGGLGGGGLTVWVGWARR